MLIHHDLHTGAREVHDFGPGRHVGEFVFEPRHPDAAEGEGWLWKMALSDTAELSGLMDEASYQAYIAEL